MKQFVVALFLLIFSASSQALSELTFLSPIFSNPAAAHSIDQMESALAAEPSESTANALLRFHLFEAYSAHQKIHAAASQLKALSQYCDTLPADAETRAAIVCVLVRGYEIEVARPIARWRKMSQLQGHLSMVQSRPLSGAEKFYTDGRMALAFFPDFHQSSRKALIPLTFFQRSNRSSPTGNYWLGEAHFASGHFDLARENFESGKALGEWRSIQRLEENFSDRQSHADGLDFGVFPGIFAGPSYGFGGQVAFQDDRMWDTRRKIGVGAAAGTRGVFVGGLEYIDQAIVDNAELLVEAQYSYRPQDFFGLGPLTTAGGVTEWWAHRFDAKVGAGYYLARMLRLRGGWRFGRFDRRSLNVEDFSGPWIEALLDTRESAYDPQGGGWIEGEAFFPSGSHSLKLTAGTFIRAGAKVGFHVVSRFASVGSTAPFALLPELSLGRRASGIREFRYQDRNAWISSIEPRWRFWGPFTACLFATGGTVAGEAGQLLSNRWLWGGGIALENRFSNERSRLVRAELGVFNSEVIFQLFASGSL